MRNKLVICLLWVGMVGLTACQSSAIAATPEAKAVEKSPATAASTNVIVQGHLEPFQFADLAFTTSGKIEEIVAQKGDKVHTGQVLARLAGRESNLAALAQAKQMLLDAQQSLEELQEQAGQAYAAALQTAIEAQTALEDAQKKRNYLNNVRGSQDQIAAAEANYLMAENQVDLLQDRYDSVSHRGEDDPVRLLALANLIQGKKSRDKALINFNWYKSKPSPADIAEADANLAKARADLELAQNNVKNLQGGQPDPKKWAAIHAQIESAQASVASAQSALDHLELRASIDGTLASLNIKPGEFIQAGATAVTLANDSAWLVKTDDLTELEVVKIQMGQKVQILLDALPGTPLSGKITDIASKFEEKRGDVTYTVTIQLDPAAKELSALRWGMTGQVQFANGQ